MDNEVMQKTWYRAVGLLMGARAFGLLMGARSMQTAAIGKPHCCSMLPRSALPQAPNIGLLQVSTASVACGVLGVGGNKGAVAVGFTLHRRKFAVVCSHFAAHQARFAALLFHLRPMKGPLFVKTCSEVSCCTLQQRSDADCSACASARATDSSHFVAPRPKFISFHALQAAWEARNANYAHIAAQLSFSKRQWLDVDGEAPRNASPLKVAKGQAAVVAARADSADDLSHPAEQSGSDQGEDEDAEDEFQVRQWLDKLHPTR